MMPVSFSICFSLFKLNGLIYRITKKLCVSECGFMQCPLRLEKDIRFSGVGVTGTCDLSMGAVS